MKTVHDLREVTKVRFNKTTTDNNSREKFRLSEGQFKDIINWHNSAYVGASFFVCNQHTGNYYALVAEDGYIAINEIKWH